MPGWFAFWPNRKSKIGTRALSRIPRAHHVPAWSTTPPIAVAEVNVNDETMDKIRRVLRGLVLAVTDASGDAQEKMVRMLEGTDDAHLVALAYEALGNLKRAKTSYDAIESDLRSVKKQLADIRKEFSIEESALREAEKAIRERDDLAVKYKELQKQLDPEKQQLEIMYAIDEATQMHKDENSALRRELGQRMTEVNDLRTSKKRLREALDRLAGKD